MAGLIGKPFLTMSHNKPRASQMGLIMDIAPSSMAQNLPMNQQSEP
jgi:hypothetical protein